MSACRPWKILHLDLAAPLPDLQLDASLDGIYTVFWWREIPLGDAWLSGAQLPLTSTRVRALALRRIAPNLAAALDLAADTDSAVAGTACLRSRFDDPITSLAHLVSAREADAAGFRASVIVCTRDRPASLVRTLESLASAVGSGDEIIVVDNSPGGDDTRRVAGKRPATQYIVEPRAGLDVARNTGLRNAGGDLVVFCDDDVEVHPRWLARFKTAFLDSRVMAATGLVLPASLATDSQYIFERYWGFGRGFRPRTFDHEYFARHRSGGVRVWEIGAGASMAFRRVLFDEIGGFDERLDAGAAGCCGDSELWYRVLAANHVCRYVPDAVAFHHHRRDKQALYGQLHAYMRGHVAALLIQFERHGHWGNLRRTVISLPYYYIKLIVRHLRRTDRRRTQTLWQEISGALAGVWFYLRNRNQAIEVPLIRQTSPQSNIVVSAARSQQPSTSTAADR